MRHGVTHSTRRSLRRLASEQGGFSLTELLATMVILALVGTVVAVGIPSAQRAYEGVMNASNAEVYLSTTVARLREVLGEADPDGEWSSGSGETLITFTSKKTGREVSILNESDDPRGIYIKEVQKDPIDDENPTHSTEPTAMVPEAAGVGATGVRFVAHIESIEPIPLGAGVEDGGRLKGFIVSNLVVQYVTEADGEPADSNAKVESLTVRTIAE